MDGANDLVVLLRIVLPLSKAMLATLALFYAVGRWNSFQDSILYINKDSLYTIQVRLRQLIQASQISTMMEDIPVMIVYPWLQKYFVKGVMIGSVKG